MIADQHEKGFEHIFIVLTELIHILKYNQKYCLLHDSVHKLVWCYYVLT